jgi:hypothetical protein
VGLRREHLEAGVWESRVGTLLHSDLPWPYGAVWFSGHLAGFFESPARDLDLWGFRAGSELTVVDDRSSWVLLELPVRDFPALGQTNFY